MDRTVLRGFADGMIAVEEGVGRARGALGSWAAPIGSLPNGINLERVTPTRLRRDVRNELGVEPSAPLIGVVGRLSPVKGHVHFVDAARLIQREEPRARFIV